MWQKTYVCKRMLRIIGFLKLFFSFSMVDYRKERREANMEEIFDDGFYIYIYMKRVINWHSFQRIRLVKKTEVVHGVNRQLVYRVLIPRQASFSFYSWKVYKNCI